MFFLYHGKIQNSRLVHQEMVIYFNNQMIKKKLDQLIDVIQQDKVMELVEEKTYETVVNHSMQEMVIDYQ